MKTKSETINAIIVYVGVQSLARRFRTTGRAIRRMARRRRIFVYDHNFIEWYRDNWKSLVFKEGQDFAIIVWDACRDFYKNLPNLPQAEAPQSRSVNPLLADVLSDIDTIDLNDGGSKFITVRKDKLKEKLGKYFS